MHHGEKFIWSRIFIPFFSAERLLKKEHGEIIRNVLDHDPYFDLAIQSRGFRS